jgi:ribosomal protein S18 acetylase RimI-like enzyme
MKGGSNMAAASDAPISVRDAYDADRQLAATLLTPDSPRGQTSLRMLAEGQGRLWIAVARELGGERIVGVLLADTRRDAEAGEQVGYIQELLVHPAYRRRGVAMHLLDAAEADFFADPQTTAATLVTSPENEGALRLYRSRGYSVDEVRLRKRRPEE